MVTSVKEFKRCCRCCLVMVDDMKPLFGACLNVMLIKLMNLQVAPTDGLPQQMCFRCVLKLSSAYTFYITVLKNQKALEEILKTAIENGEVGGLPAIAAGFGENKELNLPEKEVDTVENEDLVYEAVCTLPSNPPKETIRSNQTSTKTNIHRRVNCGGPESEESMDNEESYQCPQCKHSSKDEEDLEVHLQTHVGAKSVCKGEPDVYPQLCNICGARFRLRTSLHKHLRQHRGRLRCTHCNKTFAEASTLKVHLVSHSLEQKPYRCSVCPRAFSQPASRNKHARRHDVPRHLPCDQCHKSFLHKCSLHRHRDSAHSIHECTVCKKLFTGKKLMDMHMRYHKKKEMECSNKESPADNIPTEFIDTQTETVTVEFFCLLCTTKFQTRESLETSSSQRLCKKVRIRQSKACEVTNLGNLFLEYNF